MDNPAKKDGYFIAGEVDLSQTNLWLRLAHQLSYGGKHSEWTPLRKILDHQWILQLKGDGWLSLPQWNMELPMPEGSVALIPPGLLHGQSHSTSSHISIHFDLVANPELVPLDMVKPEQKQVLRSDNVGEVTLNLKDGSFRHQVPMVQMVSNFDWWLKRAMTLVDSWTLGRHMEPGEPLRSTAILAEFLHVFFYTEVKNEHKSIAQALAALDVFDREVRIESLAVSMGMGATAFRKAVSEITGQSPRAWLESRRCERAQFLLQDSSLAIHEIALACGYDDPYHFSRVLKRRTGLSPRAWRHQHLFL